jgi:hypothetical protein
MRAAPMHALPGLPENVTFFELAADADVAAARARTT